MPPRLPGLLVFDLDGTLIDSRRDLATAANDLIREHDGTPLDERTIGSMIGDGVVRLVERAMAAGCGLAKVDDKVVRRFRKLYARRMLEHTRAYPGIQDLLRTLEPHVPMAVLTNKPARPAIGILEGLGLLRYFGAVLGGDGPLPAKPAPDSLRYLVQEAETSADDCLLVGDSVVDLETARNAGTAIALARYGYGYEYFPVERLEGDELLLDEPAELTEYLGL